MSFKKQKILIFKIKYDNIKLWRELHKKRDIPLMVFPFQKVFEWKIPLSQENGFFYLFLFIKKKQGVKKYNNDNDVKQVGVIFFIAYKVYIHKPHHLSIKI